MDLIADQQYLYAAIHVPITPANLPPYHGPLEDADVFSLLQLVEQGYIKARSLHRHWSSTFNMDGLPHAHRHQLG